MAKPNTKTTVPKLGSGVVLTAPDSKGKQEVKLDNGGQVVRVPSRDLGKK